MPDFEPITPALPLKPLKDGTRQRGRRTTERRDQRRPRDNVTDDDGGDNDDRPLVDDYA